MMLLTGAEMNKIDQLFVRACKSQRPHLRLRSVYKRFYGDYDNKPFHISSILTKICQEHNVVRLDKLISELNPDNQYRYTYKDGLPYWEFVELVLTSQIRLCEIKKFDGFITPARFRR